MSSDEQARADVHPLLGKRLWARVENDATLHTIATVGKVWSDGRVTLERQHTPAGAQSTLVLDEATVGALDEVVGSEVDHPLECEDMVGLVDPSERVMLHMLRERYASDVIFTSIGAVLVALNPYKPVAQCQASTIAELSQLEPEALPAHAFAIAEAAYTGLVDTVPGCPQSILVSGESGAGKTETTKLLVACLALVSSSSGAMVEAALESGLLLEAFGNARTVYNNNSSRFGKWCEQLAASTPAGRGPSSCLATLAPAPPSGTGAPSTLTTGGGWPPAASPPTSSSSRGSSRPGRASATTTSSTTCSRAPRNASVLSGGSCRTTRRTRTSRAASRPLRGSMTPRCGLRRSRGCARSGSAQSPHARRCCNSSPRSSPLATWPSARRALPPPPQRGTTR